MSKKRLTEVELLEGLNEHTAHADELAGSVLQGELGTDEDSRILRSIDEDMNALNAAGLKTQDWDRFKSS